MAIKRVTWEYTQGVPAFINMINMLETALIKVAPSGKLKKTAGWSWMGFYLDSIYFIGTRYDQPLLIAFENNIGTNPTYSRYFDMEQEHFFALSQDEQFEAFVDFLHQAIKDTPSEEEESPVPLETLPGEQSGL